LAHLLIACLTPFFSFFRFKAGALSKGKRMVLLCISEPSKKKTLYKVPLRQFKHAVETWSIPGLVHSGTELKRACLIRPEF
jgi:hypothetical protein